MISNSDLVSTKPLRIIFCSKLASAGLQTKFRNVIKSLRIKFFPFKQILTLQDQHHHYYHHLPIFLHRPSAKTNCPPKKKKFKKYKTIVCTTQKLNDNKRERKKKFCTLTSLAISCGFSFASVADQVLSVF